MLNYFTLSEQARWEGLSKSFETTGTHRASSKSLLWRIYMVNEEVDSTNPI